MTSTRPGSRAARSRLLGGAALVAAVVGIFALYLPRDVMTGRRQLYGADFLQTHQYRLEFFREAVSSGYWRVPAWYPREAMGTPFRADPQNFPWSPTRLPLLLLPPAAAYAPGVLLDALAALLAAYFLAVELGLSRWAGAAVGFTFAASGMFASRVMAGQLPNLDGYAALPLLLLLAERAVRRESADSRRRLVALGVATACVALTGHPQFPAYSIVLAAIYLLWRAGRRAARPLAAMVLGGATTLFCWWPAFLLVIRSARALPLARPGNDVPFPWARLAALFAPWRDGWPAAVLRHPAVAFHGFVSDAVFWETSDYVGLLPWVALAVLTVLVVWRRQPISRRALFYVVAPLVCVILAMPFAQAPLAAIHVLVFRSPARLFIVPVLALALAFGFAVDRLGARAGALGLGAALVLIALQAGDLVVHAAPFVRSTVALRAPRPRIEAVLARDGGASRVAFDYNLPIAPTRRYDDVGFFSSLQLASTYRALLALAGAPPTASVQYFSGARELPAPALANLGVRYVSGLVERPDLKLLFVEGGVPLYEVERPVARASFFPESSVRLWSERDMPTLLSRPDTRLDRHLYLRLAREPESAERHEGEGSRPLTFRRPTPDSIEVDDVDAAQAGYVRLLEAHDPGWSAEVDGRPARVLRSEGFLLAVHVPAGTRRIVFHYATPGGTAGWVLSLVALLAFVAFVRRAEP